MMNQTASSYDKYPEIRIDGFEADVFGAPSAIVEELSAHRESSLVIVECYPGVGDEILDLAVEALQPSLVIRAEDTYSPREEVDAMFKSHVTDDRVRGVMFRGSIADVLDKSRVRHFVDRACGALAQGQRVLVYGFGAYLIGREVAGVTGMDSLLVYCDLARWEIQLRYRAGMPNHFWDNADEDVLRKVKRGFFIEWRIADRLKRTLFDEIDYLIDSNRAGAPKMITGEAFRAGLDEVVSRPFRLVPYFDPGVWGGQWMKECFGLDESAENYAWSFDGVPEENSLYLRYGSVRVEIPAQDAVLARPVELMGPKNYSRFGAEFPIRFDFLDTMGGQNLSLQVHPLTDYITTHFGMTYTQDESYYILDCGEGGGVYLGLKEGIDSRDMIWDLREAQAGMKPFEADRYVNFFPASKHDHFLIPAGTVHCSSANCMVLEISATPYIFTFKLWDWDRVGLDGKPRPIHIDDGERNIQWGRTTDWVESNLVNRFEELSSFPGAKIERTGLHELEFIETRRLSLSRAIEQHTQHGVHVLNLVEGSAARIASPRGAFEPFVVHYAETFIVPAAIDTYSIEPAIPGEEIKVMQAFVRN